MTGLPLDERDGPPKSKQQRDERAPERVRRDVLTDRRRAPLATHTVCLAHHGWEYPLPEVVLLAALVYRPLSRSDPLCELVPLSELELAERLDELLVELAQAARPEERD